MPKLFYSLILIVSFEAAADSNPDFLPKPFTETFLYQKQWSSAQLEPGQIQQNFDDWIQCYSRMNKGESYSSCQCTATGEPLPGGLGQFGIRLCSPGPLDTPLVYSREISKEKARLRDDLICECYLKKDSFERVLSGNPTLADQNRSAGLMERRRSGRLDSLRFKRLFGESFGPAISVTNFARSDEEAKRLAGVYLPRKRSEDRALETFKNVIEGELTDEMCIPQREYLFFQSFPRDLEIYQGFSGDFRSDDWDYEKLAEKVRPYEYGDLFKNEETKLAVYRIKFLRNNPQLKSLFMAKGTKASQIKAELFGLLKKSYPKMSCHPGVLDHCDMDEKWLKQIRNYQNEMADFLGKPEVNDVLLNGVEQGRLLRFTTSTGEFDSETAFEKPGQGSFTDWTSFCKLRKKFKNPETPNKNLEEIERGVIDFSNVNDSPVFKSMNRNYCVEPRKSRDGETQSTFKQFRQTSCSGVPARDCLTKFVTEFPRASNPIAQIEYSFFNNFIVGNKVATTKFSKGSTQEINAVSQSASARRENFKALAEISSSSGTGDIARVDPVPLRSPASTKSSQNPEELNPSSVLPSSTFVPNFLPQVSPSEVSKVRELGQTAQDSENRSKQIREEFELLRDQISEQKASNPTDPRIAELTAQVERLEEQNKRAEQIAESDRKRYEAALARVQSGKPLEEDEDPESSSSDVKEEKAIASAGVSAAVKQDSSSNLGNTSGSNGTIAPLPSSGNLKPSGSGLSSKSSSVNGLRSLNTELLRNNGVLPSGITVSQADSTIGNSDSDLKIPLTPEEFSIVEASQSQLIARISKSVTVKPGETVEVDLVTENSRSMKIFVKMTDSGLAIVDAPTVPSRGLASEAERAKLQDLQNEFQELPSP